MARVKSAMTTRARHKKVLKQAKGYYGAKHYRFRNANQNLYHMLMLEEKIKRAISENYG